nr:hypothetical protein [Actinokineospora enzanensis]
MRLARELDQPPKLRVVDIGTADRQGETDGPPRAMILRNSPPVTRNRVRIRAASAIGITRSPLSHRETVGASRSSRVANSRNEIPLSLRNRRRISPSATLLGEGGTRISLSHREYHWLDSSPASLIVIRQLAGQPIGPVSRAGFVIARAKLSQSVDDRSVTPLCRAE